MALPDAAPDNYQAGYDRRWGGLRHAHVRALAWLLDAPGLLDAHDPGWDHQVMALEPVSPDVERWLYTLDHDPAPLDAAMGARAFTRLGLYAEKLMAFYFQTQGRLVAHGLQVRAGRNDTVGEFDFLLDAGVAGMAGLDHVELATKFYLLQPHGPAGLDALVGPNLADSLGAKMRKIIDRQLALGRHPAAQALLARPVLRAQALVKGWLFYPHDASAVAARRGIAPGHCRGFWCALDDIPMLPDGAFVILPKLQWLAPYRGADDASVLTRAALSATLAAQFAASGNPVLVAQVRQAGGAAVETGRGFIVPAPWRALAAAL